MPSVRAHVERPLRVLDAALFLPAWGALLGLGIGLSEKLIVHYTGGSVAGEIMALFLGVVVLAGLGAGVLLTVLFLIAVALGARPRPAFVLLASVLSGLAVQALFVFHPEFLSHEQLPIMGHAFIERGAAGLVAAALLALVALRARAVFSALAVGSLALVVGVSLSRFFPRESLLNAMSLPMIALLAAGPLAGLAGLRYRVAGWLLAAAMAAGFVGYLARTGNVAWAEVYQGPQTRSNKSLAGGRPNLIVIVLDTLRPSHVSGLGYHRRTTPSIDAFLQEATLYPRAKAVSSWTLPTHGSLFTGLWPRTHGARFADKELFGGHGTDVKAIAHPLRDNIPTLAEVMGSQGYLTAGIVSNYGWLGGGVFSINRGFDYYFCGPRYAPGLVGKRTPIPSSLMLDRMIEKWDRLRDANRHLKKPYYTADSITKKAVRWLGKNRDESFFLFLNYLDPHSPYNPPPPYDVAFEGKVRPRGFDVKWDFGTRGVMVDREDMEPRLAAELVSQYDGEIAYMDFWLGVLFERIREMGLWDESYIVVMSDHGEGFGEHRLLEHGVSLYEGEAAMLLAIKRPGQSTPRRDEAMVQTHDIMPTILRDLRILAPAPMEGEPIDSLSHPVVSELFPHHGRAKFYGDRFLRRLTAIYDGEAKYIRSSKGPVEMYDLSSDPLELTNLAGGAASAALAAKLDAWEKAHPIAEPSMGHIIDKVSLERLKSLGYIQ